MYIKILAILCVVKIPNIVCIDVLQESDKEESCDPNNTTNNNTINLNNTTISDNDRAQTWYDYLFGVEKIEQKIAKIVPEKIIKELLPKSWKNRMSLQTAQSKSAYQLISDIAHVCEINLNIQTVEDRDIVYSCNNTRGIDCIIEICEELNWRYIMNDDGSIVVCKNVKYWHIHELSILFQNNKTSVNQSMGNSSMSHTNISTEFDIWHEIETTLGKLIDKDSKYSIDKSSGMINIFAFQREHKIVNDYLYKLIDKKKNILLDIKMIAINDSEDVNLDINCANPKQPNEDDNKNQSRIFEFLYSTKTMKNGIHLSQSTVNGVWCSFNGPKETWFNKKSIITNPQNKKPNVTYEDSTPIKTGISISCQPILKKDGSVMVSIITSLSLVKTEEARSVDTAKTMPTITTKEFNSNISLKLNQFQKIFSITMSEEELSDIGITLKLDNHMPNWFSLFGFKYGSKIQNANLIMFLKAECDNLDDLHRVSSLSEYTNYNRPAA